MTDSSAGSRLHLHDSRELGLPLVSVIDKLLLVVKQLLVEECRVFEVGALDNGVDGASLLAEAAENALGHVDVVLGRATGAIGSRLRLDRDSESRASSFAQLAGDAAFFTGGVATQGVLATEHGAQRSLLPRVVKNVLKVESKRQG